MFKPLVLVILLPSVLFALHARPPLDKIEFEDPRVSMIAGIRPYREGGVRIEVESFGSTHVVHNYGHGGGGITLSWGTVEEAITLARPHLDRASKILVVGSGVIGLTTSYELARMGYTHTIYSADFSEKITSYIAGGLWKPASVEVSKDPKIERRIVTRSYQRYLELNHFAVRKMPYFRVTDPEKKNPFAFDVLIALGLMPKMIPHPELPIEGVFAPGKEFESLLIDTPQYMSDLLRQARTNAELRLHKFESKQELLELAGENALVFNCTGLGSKKLFGDESLIPYRGQLVLIEREGFFEPSDDDFMVAFGDYYFPRKTHLVLGGTYEKGEWDPTPDPVEGRRILENHRKFFGF